MISTIKEVIEKDRYVIEALNYVKKGQLSRMFPDIELQKTKKKNTFNVITYATYANGEKHIVVEQIKGKLKDNECFIENIELSQGFKTPNYNYYIYYNFDYDERNKHFLSISIESFHTKLIVYFDKELNMSYKSQNLYNSDNEITIELIKLEKMIHSLCDINNVSFNTALINMFLFNKPFDNITKEMMELITDIQPEAFTKGLQISNDFTQNHIKKNSMNTIEQKA